MTAYFNFTIWQDGEKVAGASGPDESKARREALHYALRYEQDGPVTVKQGNRILYRTPASQAAAAPDEHADRMNEQGA